MTREELYNSICPYLVDCENTNCDSCNEILNRLFDKYDKQIRAEVLEDVEKILEELKTISKLHSFELD